MFVFKGRSRRRRNDGRADRPDDRRRGHPGGAQGHRRRARAGGPRRGAQRDHAARSANSPRTRQADAPSRPRRRSRRSSGGSRARPPTARSATSTSWSRRCRSGWTIKQSVFAELDAATPGHAILASNTSSLSITEIGEATLRPEQGRRLPLLLPRVDHAADRDRRGRGDRGGDGRPRRSRSRRRSASSRSPARRCPASSSTASSTRASRRSGASRRRRGSRSSRSTRASARGRRADRPLLADQPARPGHRAARRRAPARVLRRGTLLRAEGHAEARRQRQARREDRRRRLLRPAGRAEPRRRGRAGHRGAVELLSLKTLLEACLVLEEGVATHRDIDFGMMAGAGLDPRRGLLPPFMERRQRGPRHGARADGERAGALRRALRAARRSCAAWSRRAGSGRRAGRASTPTRSPTPSSRPRSSSSRRARDGVAIAWLANGQMNSISPQVDRGPRRRSGRRSRASRRARARDRLLEPVPVLRGRRHQGVHDDGRGLRRGADRRRARAVQRARLGGRRDDRRRQRAGLRRRLRAGDGLRRAHRRALGAVRPAGDQARHHPRLRRHAAPAAAGRARTRRSR